ncbi:DUF3798 domain-containing protein [Tindallia californiensis]|uniref:DUF3798 domain-containing protein n=1 Tax=Tindallia californiensis TaxID=159292 RepID=A0A1H3Q271_9FIRM|nr:DUF3798 domain-containing protein [Tindallia californiensis]SDZ07208.1 Protein of unknown function [Tindallia californiensis]
MRKTLALLLAMMMVFSLVGCGGSEPAAEPAEDGGETADAVEETSSNYKIGIMTGTVSQGEEEFRAAENMRDKYGDMIVLSTYPDRFMQEQETTITNMMAMASDPDVKAIVMVQAVPGAAAAIARVREIRDDILIVLGVPGEDPDVIADYGDVIIQTNDLARGPQIAQQAQEMGAEVLVHYSFPRHMSYEMLASRRDLMKEEAERIGLTFIEEDAPDPTGDAGVPGTQQFIMEDVPRKIEEFGKNTAFFGSNCAMMEPMIRQTVEHGALYPVQCCPSPYHALPAALGISVSEEQAGDLDYIITEIGNKCAEADMQGRVGTWSVPVNMMYVEAGVEYAIEYLEGNTDGKADAAVLTSIMSEIAGGDIELSNYEGYDHFFLYLGAPIIF